MKRRYLLTLSCLVLSTAGAQNRVPRPKASGVNFSVNQSAAGQSDCQTLPAGRKALPGRRGQMPALLADKLETLGGLQTLVPAAGVLPGGGNILSPDAKGRGAGAARRMNRTQADRLRRMMRVPAAARVLREAGDTTLCTARQMAVDGRLVQRDTIAYDRYGLRSLLTRYDADAWDSKQKQERYTYTIGAGNYWTSRIIETDYRPWGYDADEPARDWWVNNTVVRELDSVGRVLSVSLDDPRSQWQKTERYDYGHLYYDYDGNPHVGFMVDYDNRQYGEQKARFTYRWHEAARQYLPVYWQQYGTREVSEHYADSVVTTTWTQGADTAQWTMSTIVTDFYRLDGNACTGYLTRDLQSGSSTGQREFTIEAGDTTTVIEQEWIDSTGVWAGLRKVVTAGSYLFTPSYYEMDYRANESGAWYLFEGLTLKLVHEAPDFALFERTDVYGGASETSISYVARRLVDSLYYTFQNWDRVDEETFVNRVDDGNTTYFFYYGPDGNLKTGYMLVKGINTPVGEADRGDGFYTMYVLQDDGSWKQGNEFSYYFRDTRVQHFCNEQGYPERIVVTDRNTGDPIREMRYTYTDRGYTEDTYEADRLTTRVVYEAADGSWFSTITYNYGWEGQIEMATRTDEKPGGRRTYDWDGQNFTIARVEAFDFTYTTGDGTNMTRKSVAEGNDVVPVTLEGKRYVYAEGSWQDLVTAWHWSREAGEWVGDSARMDYYLIYDFAPDYGRSDFIENYDDGNDGYGESDTRHELTTVQGTILYGWVPDEKLFRRTQKYGTDFGMDDSTAIIYHYDGYMTGAQVYELGEGGRVAREYYLKVSDGGNTQVPQYINGYAYTPEGFLLSREMSDSVSHTLERFTYEQRALILTGIDELRPGATARLTIEGLSVSAPDQRIRLFTLQGAQVAAGQGSVTAPRPGIYVVRVGAASTKVLLR